MPPTRDTGRLADKVAVVVGGATGLGLATSERFATEGARVVVAGRRGGLATEVGERLGGSGIELDITDFDAMNEATAAILGQHGRIDVGVNYAGYEQNTLIRDLTPETWEPMVAVQFTGAVWFIRAMASAMAEGGGGSIVSVSSLTAQDPSPGQAAYAGSKKGLEYVTQIAAVEYGGDEVRVNCVAPHLIETPMTEWLFQSELVIEAVRNQTPLGRMGDVDDVASAVLFLASDEAGYITGQTICVDGGASTQKLPSTLDYEILAAARPDLL
ncbi:MAG: SDR family oxidoreductase [Acidimicrobiia bacterium]|nr:SDR family oxidoreductase [Acidimicrobiia bacterium]